MTLSHPSVVRKVSFSQEALCTTSSTFTAIVSFSLLHVPPLRGKCFSMSSSTFTVIRSLLLFRLIHRFDTQSLYIHICFHSHWEFSPFLPDALLGYTCPIQPHPVSQLLGVSSSSSCSLVVLHRFRFSAGNLVVPHNTYHHQTALLYRTCCGEALYWHFVLLLSACKQLC